MATGFKVRELGALYAPAAALVLLELRLFLVGSAVKNKGQIFISAGVSPTWGSESVLARLDGYMLADVRSREEIDGSCSLPLMDVSSAH